MILAVNLLGDWLRDAMNPQLRKGVAPVSAPLLETPRAFVDFPTRRGTLVAVDDISFSIQPGDVLGMVGESGAGKSMTGNAVISLLEPPGRIAGACTIKLAGRRIDNLSYEEIRRIRGRRIGARFFRMALTSLNPLEWEIN